MNQAYNFNPIPEGLPREYEKKILGLGCQMWGEEIMQNERMYHLIFPRIAAYAETCWTLPDKKDYTAFLKSLNRLIKIWNHFPLTIFFISFSLFSASSGVRLFTSKWSISSRI